MTRTVFRIRFSRAARRTETASAVRGCSATFVSRKPHVWPGARERMRRRCAGKRARAQPCVSGMGQRFAAAARILVHVPAPSMCRCERRMHNSTRGVLRHILRQRPYSPTNPGVRTQYFCQRRTSGSRSRDIGYGFVDRRRPGVGAVEQWVRPTPVASAYGPSTEGAGTRVCGYAIKNGGPTVV
jgi:hypothetical protein